MTTRLIYPRSFWILVTAIAGLSLWIRMAFLIHAIGPAGHDDLLFVRQAALIGTGEWLGDYSSITHAKGIGYSLFLLLNHITGLPLKFTEQALFLVASACFASTVGQLFHSRSAALATFVLLAFMPTVWTAEVGGRVVREGLYVSQALMLLTLGIRYWVLPATIAPIAEQLRNHWRPLALLGLLAGWFWITREEGIWLLPAMLVLLAYWLMRQSNWLGQWRAIAGFVALPFVTALLVIGAVNTANYAVYGVFRNNDFRSGDFQAGYGALTRIRHDDWQRYVLFPKDARERAYAMSAAARELQPFFEGAGGESWRSIGCAQTSTIPCTEILSGWFMWALRDAVASAGHYQSARAARNFYRRLAAEIDAGCRMRPGDCLPARATMLPPWHEGYTQDSLKAAWAIFQTLSTLGKLPPYNQASTGDAKSLALFDKVTNGPLALPAEISPITAVGLHSPRDAIRMQLAEWFTHWISKLSTWGLPLAFIAWLMWSIPVLGHIAKHKRAAEIEKWIVATSLAAAIVTRVVLLGILEATSMPSNNMLYLLPLVPISLAMIAFMLLAVVYSRTFKKSP